MFKSQVGGCEIYHDYRYDPTYGYDLVTLLEVDAPPEVEGFSEFWRERFSRAVKCSAGGRLKDLKEVKNGWKVSYLTYQSADGFPLAGWALVPEVGEVMRAFVVGHGYGGREGPSFDLPFTDAVLIFPCARGLGLSRHPDLPFDPNQHVVHGIEDRDRYVIGGCVEDTWLAVTALLELFPEVEGNVGLLGISFSGGVFMLAAPWDDRVSRLHCNVPTFGHQPLRSKLESVGSSVGVQAYEKEHPGEALATLAYFDAAVAARHIRIPVHCACALFDPAVAPPGQYAIYNALPEELRELMTLTAGHHEYAGQEEENRKLLQELNAFFA